MLLKGVFTELINEATAKEIYDRYYSGMPYSVFYRIVSTDPQTKEKNQDIVKIGKYSKILLNLYRKDQLELEDLPKATEYLSLAYKHHVPLQMDEIHTISDIYLKVKKYALSDDTSMADVLVHLKQGEDYDKVFDSRNWEIFIPKTEKGACYLGVGSQWCTTYGPLSLRQSYQSLTNYFNTYNSTSPLYIIVNKENEKEKFQFHFSSNQFMDINDRGISVPGFFSDNPELIRYFFPSFKVDDPTKELVMADLKNSKYLPKGYKDILMERMMKMMDEFGGNLTSAIIAGDTDAFSLMANLDTLKTKIKDVSVGYSNDIGIDLSYDRYGDGILDELKSMLNIFAVDNFESLYLNDYDGSDIPKETANEFLTEYFNKNRVELLTQLRKAGIKDEDDFIDMMEKYGVVKDLEEAFLEWCTDKNADVANDSVRALERQTEQHIKSGSYDIEINKFSFIELLMYKDMDRIVDFEAFMEDFCSYFDIPTSYTDMYEEISSHYYQHSRSPSYDDLKDKIEDLVDDLIEKAGVDMEAVKEARDGLNAILTKFHFKKLSHKESYMYDNGKVRVIVNPTNIDVEKNMVEVNIKDLENAKQYDGHVKIENLPRYLTNLMINYPDN